MERLLVSRYLEQLSFLQPTSQAQVLSYLSLLQARHYARGTLDAVVTILKRFSRHVPTPGCDRQQPGGGHGPRY